MTTRSILLATLCSLAASATAADSTFTPLSDPGKTFTSESNTGEFFRPNLGTFEEARPLKVRVSATKDSVTGGVAMKWVFEKDAKGQITFEKSDYDSAAAGITFYAKASKPIHLRVCGDVRQEKKKVVEIGTEWRKHDFSWAEMGGTQDWWQLVFQVTDPISERTTLWLDRVGVEGPAFDPAPTIDVQSGTDQAISSSDILYGAEHLAKTVERLKAKQPFKIVALGDSISAGAQSTRGSWGIDLAKGVAFRYFGQVAHVCEQHFGYTGITPVAVAHGGWTTKMLLGVVDTELMPQLSADDLVVLQSGGNDIANGSAVDVWKNDLKAIIAKIRTKTDQILVVDTVVTASGPVVAQAEAISKTLRDIVAEEKVAGADVTKFLTYRGPGFACALLANDYHPDFTGHMIIGDMIAPILTGKHVTYPE
ncbi:MAG: SGNH/GDSL hydrolase family protein [Planctomycetes bacterium]|nr:SGNH/GDSL hydrolase family protein [Planctomycetota bacterium]